jgi:hypothetical protein
MSYYDFFTVTLLLWMLINLGLLLFVAYRKLDELESYFTENEAVQRTKRFWRRSLPIDKTMRMVVIVELLSMPKRHLKKGEVTEAELTSVPVALKRWAVWPYYGGMVLMVLAIIWEVWSKP